MATDGTNDTNAGKDRKAEPLSNGDLGKYGVWVKSEPKDIMVDMAMADEDDMLDISIFEPETSGSAVKTRKEPDIDVEFSMDELDSEPESLPEMGENEIESISLEDDELLMESETDEISIDTETLDTAIRRASGTAKDVEEEFSVEDFGTSDSESASSLSDDVNIADFLGEEPAADEPENADERDENPTIDINLEFDDTIDDSSPEKESIDFDPSDFEDVVPATGGSMELESVTDFDDFLNGEDGEPLEASNEGLLKKATPASSREGMEKPSTPSAEDLPEIVVESDDSYQPSSVRKPKAVMMDTDLEEISIEDLHKSDSSFNDVEALERDLQSSKPSHTASSSENFSKDLLLKIASELSSIKSELSSLKQELANFKHESPEAESALTPQEAEAQEKKKAGFFEEDTDETIALTGDELDNILNTADFTEETGTAVEETDSLDLEAIDDWVTTPKSIDEEVIVAESLSDLGNILSEDGSDQQEPVTVPSRSIPRPKPDIAPIETEDLVIHSEEVLLNEAQKIAPMTAPPEDTSYLDDDLGEVYLEESPLEEPDLSDIEPEEMEREKHSDETIEEITLDDLTLSMDDGSDMGLESSVEEIQQAEEMDLATESLDFETISDEALSEIKLSDETDSESSLSPGNAFMEMVEEPDFPDNPDLLTEPDDFDDAEEISLSENIAIEPEIEPPSKPTVPVSIHPDDIAMELNDDMFVSPARLDNENVPARETPAETPGKTQPGTVNGGLKEDIKSVLLYMDKLLESLPDDKIDEFARSEHFTVYKKLFEELGLI